MVRYTITIDYDEDPGEDLGAVGRALADVLAEQDGVDQAQARIEWVRSAPVA